MSKGKENTTTTGPLSRDQMRAHIFSAKAECKEIQFFGTSLELRQPTLGTVLDMQQQSVEHAALYMLINFAFVPGTDEKVFESADEEGLMKMPFGPDMKRLTDAVNELMGVDVEALQKKIADATKSPEAGTAEVSGDDDSGGAGEN
jgi:hypothetical protein